MLMQKGENITQKCTYVTISTTECMKLCNGESISKRHKKYPSRSVTILAVNNKGNEIKVD